MSVQDDEEDESMDVVASGEEIVFESDGESSTGTETSKSPSPLAGKSKGKKANQYREIRQSVPDGPECLPLPSECSDDDAIDSEDDGGTEVSSQTTEETEEDEEEKDDEEDEWVPPIAPTPKARTSKANNSRFSSMSSTEPSSVAPTTIKTRASKGRVSKLEKEMQGLSLGGESDSDLSAYMLPSTKARRVTAVDEESASEEDELDTIKKKKKRSLGKQPAVIDVEQTPMRIRSTQTSKGRQTRGGK